MLDPNTEWTPELLDKLLVETPIAVQSVAQYALEAEGLGAAWVRERILHSDLPTATRVPLAIALASRHGLDEETAAFVREWLDDPEPWTRFGAARALAGPWGAAHVDSLATALRDKKTLSDLWSVYRISDAAAAALLRTGHPRAQETVSGWVREMEADLRAAEQMTRELATFALAKLGHGGATAQLRVLAQEQDDWQAQELLEELEGKRKGGV